MDVKLLIPLLWVGAYLSGSVPSGLLIAHLKGVDIRRQGSGNIGTANVYRCAGRGAAAATLSFDVLKGLVPVLAARTLDLPLWAQLGVGIAAIVGHNWSVFLRGRGGKGVATSLGVLVGLAPPVVLAAILVWATVILLSRYASLASLLMMASVPLTLAIFGYTYLYWLFGVALVCLALYRHRANINRLLSGTELKIDVTTSSHGD